MQMTSYISSHVVTRIYNIVECLCILGQRPKLASYSERAEFY